MSYTAIYSPLKSIERDRWGARIEDLDAWNEWRDEDGLKGTAYKKAATREEKGCEEYPRREYDVLYGFRTWDRKDAGEYPDYSTSTLGCHFNIERFGYWYGGEFESFWADLSEFTEPFLFYHPEPEYGVSEHAGDIIENGAINALKVRCENGDVEISKFEIEARAVDTDTDRPEDSP